MIAIIGWVVSTKPINSSLITGRISGVVVHGTYNHLGVLDGLFRKRFLAERAMFSKDEGEYHYKSFSICTKQELIPSKSFWLLHFIVIIMVINSISLLCPSTATTTAPSTATTTIRSIIHRTRGRGGGRGSPITRLMSPSDLGQVLKPLSFWISLTLRDTQWRPWRACRCTRIRVFPP